MFPSNESVLSGQSKDNLSVKTSGSSSTGGTHQSNTHNVSCATSLEAEVVLTTNERVRKTSKEPRTNLRIMSYSSTPDIVSDVDRLSRDEKLRNARFTL